MRFFCGMKNSILHIILMLTILWGGSAAVWAETEEVGVSGVVLDAETGETLPFVQIYFIKPDSKGGTITTSIGTTSDLDGNFEISNKEGYTTVNFQMMGYKLEMVNLRAGQFRKGLKVKLHPDVYKLQDIVVTPKHTKQQYRRKDNPAVALIKNVIANRESYSVKTEEKYTADTYSRMSFSLDNFHPNFKKGFWKTFAFAEKYIDTTTTSHTMTVSLREHLGKEYYQRRPHREKTRIEKRRIFGLEDVIDSEQFQENINAVFQDPNINEDNMKLLFNRFVSPLNSSIAVTFYQYYIMDTLLVDGYECIDLAFVPVNSESYGFTGHLYIVNDSTYQIKKYSINVPPHINLNFVSDYSVEHNNKQLENGLWAPDRTITYAKFYLFNYKKGLVARQTKLYTQWDFESEIDKRVFQTTQAIGTANDSVQRIASAEWANLRPEPLTWYETSVADLVHEFTSNKTFASLAMLANALTTEYVPATPAEKMSSSKFDFGPIYNFVSWNTLEGLRLRIGGVSNVDLHKHIFFRGYLAFGCYDLRPKGSFTFLYSFPEKNAYAYEPYRHFLQFTAQYDVETPGQATDIISRDNIFGSIPLSTPTQTNSQYVLHAKLTYMKEWKVGVALQTTFDFTHNEAAGAMRYDRIVDYQPNGMVALAERFDAYKAYTGTVSLRYSPGSPAVMSRLGVYSAYAIDKDAPVITLEHKFGYLDDRDTGGKGFFINHTELTIDKRFWLSAFGHLDVRLQTGMIWNQIPFTELYAPKTSTSIFLSQRAFNLMHPMEFLMDEYVGLYCTYYFKGWLINRIPGLNKTRLRGVLSFAGIYGGLTDKNNPYCPDNQGLYRFPESAQYDMSGQYVSGQTCSPIGKIPYMEITAGFENILKFIRIDYIRRLTYNEYMLPDGVHTRKIGAWGRNGVKITFRFAL